MFRESIIGVQSVRFGRQSVVAMIAIAIFELLIAYCYAKQNKRRTGEADWLERQ